MVGITKMGYR